MTEKELISEFDRFGYSILKSDGNVYVHQQKIEKYSIFDRRIARRVAETDSLEGLAHYANDIFNFPMWSEVYEKTVDYFIKEFSCSPVTVPEPVTGKKEQSEPEQEDKTPPAIPEPGLIEKICPTCGKTFKTSHKQRRYCSESCYPSEAKKPAKNASEVV